MSTPTRDQVPPPPKAAMASSSSYSPSQTTAAKRGSAKSAPPPALDKLKKQGPTYPVTVKSKQVPATRQKKSFFPSFLFRIVLVYLLYLSVWKCPPSSTLNSESPQLCHPIHSVFDSAKHYIEPLQIHAASQYDQHISPHLTPYLEKAKPFTDKAFQAAVQASDAAVVISNKAQTALKPILAPYVAKSSDLYNAKIAPVLAKQQGEVLALWNSNVQPHVHSLNLAVANTWQKVSPHYNSAVTKSSPYISAAQKHGSSYANKGYVNVKSKVLDPGCEYLVKGSRVAYAYSRDSLYPIVEKHVTTAWNCISEKVNSLWLTVFENSSPKVKDLYYDKVEPQVVKVMDRIQNGSPDSGTATSVSEPEPSEALDNSISSEASKASSEPIASSVTKKTIVETTTSIPLSASTVKTQESVIAQESAKPKESPIVKESAKPKESPIAKESAKSAKSSGIDFEKWKNIVGFTTTEAIEHLVRDIGNEKLNLITKGKPQFTRLLQSLQKQQQLSVTSLIKLVGDIEAEVNRYAEYEETGSLPSDYDFPYALTNVQATFKDNAQSIRVETSAVRAYAQEFAGLILNATEQIRTSTIDTLDEFAEVTLQEIGRKLVTEENPEAQEHELVDKNSDEIENEFAPAGASKMGSKKPHHSNAGWKEWKEYRKLKDRLLVSRKEISEYQIPMQDVNEMLKTAQETGTVLAKEAAQYMSNLKAKVDHLFMRKLAIDKKLEEKGKKVDSGMKLPEDDEDVIFYEELEDEPVAKQKQHATNVNDKEPVEKVAAQVKEKEPVVSASSVVESVGTEPVSSASSVVQSVVGNEPVSSASSVVESVVGTEPVSSASSVVQSVVGTEPVSSASSVVQSVVGTEPVSSASSVVESVVKSVVGTELVSSASSVVQSVVGTEPVSSASSVVQSVVGTEPVSSASSVVQSVVGTEPVSSASSVVQSVVGTEPISSAKSAATQVSSFANSLASEPSKSAQSVVESDPLDSLSSIASKFGSAVEDAVSHSTDSIKAAAESTPEPVVGAPVAFNNQPKDNKSVDTEIVDSEETLVIKSTVTLEKVSSKETEQASTESSTTIEMQVPQASKNPEPEQDEDDEEEEEEVTTETRTIYVSKTTTTTINDEL